MRFQFILRTLLIWMGCSFEELILFANGLILDDQTRKRSIRDCKSVYRENAPCLICYLMIKSLKEM